MHTAQTMEGRVSQLEAWQSSQKEQIDSEKIERKTEFGKLDGRLSRVEKTVWIGTGGLGLLEIVIELHRMGILHL